MSVRAIFALLHDGFIRSVERRGDELVVGVACLYLRQRFPGEGRGFVITLRGQPSLSYEPFGGTATEDPAAIVADEPDLISVEPEGDGLLVWSSAARIRVHAADATLALDDGTPVTVDEVRAAAKAYWDEFSRRR